MRLRFYYMLYAIVISSCGTTLVTRVVRTKYGDITGTIVSPNPRFLDAVEVYKGIPYAAPPLGNLRFMPPVSGAQWSGARVADKFAPVCPQNLPDISNETLALKRMPKGRLDFLKRLLPYLKNQSEDCLYLNIYAPTQGTIHSITLCCLRSLLICPQNLDKGEKGAETKKKQINFRICSFVDGLLTLQISSAVA